MPLSKFFGRRDEPAREEPVDAAEEVNDDEIDVGDVNPESLPEEAPEIAWTTRARKVVPLGASTGSKRAENLYGEVIGDLPTHFASARGVLIRDVGDYEYIDCTMALGAVALGYAEPRVTQAAIQAINEGNLSALSSWREVELAERLCALIPCAERAQFLKSGAEAVSAAVRLARTYTSRENVLACGYFGWHDWCSTSAGVPSGARQSVTQIAYDDIAGLERAVSESAGNLAAIVIEPVIERAPSTEWLTRARQLCDKSGAVLIFDEMKTGFRMSPGGYQEICGVTPDLATFGKALANGFPVAAVVGNSAVMSAAEKTWISSTLASESAALAAALAVLDWHDEADICASLGEIGTEMRACVDRAIEASGIAGVRTEGVAQMFSLVWDDHVHEDAFVQHAMRNGVLFKRGAYNFAAIAHDESALQDIEAAASAAFVAMLEQQ